jgi:hypothetical protein
MKDVLCLVTSAATVACLLVFVIALKPRVISSVKGSYEFCAAGRFPAQACDWSIVAAMTPGSAMRGSGIVHP